MQEILISEKVPPQAVDVEQAVLGAMLLDKEAIAKAIEFLDESCFYKDAHRMIYSCIVSLFDRNQPTDLLTVPEELLRHNQLEKVGGRAYIIELASNVVTSANVEHHARIVLEKSNLRKLLSLATQIAAECYDPTQEVDFLLDRAEQQIFSIAEQRIKEGFVSIGKILPHTFEEIEEYHRKVGSITGVPTGFIELDQITAGLQKSDLIVVAGRPSMGKTSLCLGVAMNAALYNGIPVGVFSLEMSKEQLALRMLCSHAGLSAHKLRTKRLSDSDWPRLSSAAGALTEAKIFIDDAAGIGILEMRAKARRLKSHQDIGLLVVDYLQLMQGPKNAESRQQEISIISRSLKNLAKELNIPVIAISQLSRKAEDRIDKRPQLADLRESGSIEQDADVVMMVYRPEFYKITEYKERGKMSTEGTAEIIIAKNRNGPTGDLLLAFVKDYAKFGDLEKYRKEEVPPF